MHLGGRTGECVVIALLLIQKVGQQQGHPILLQLPGGESSIRPDFLVKCALATYIQTNSPGHTDQSITLRTLLDP